MESDKKEKYLVLKNSKLGRYIVAKEKLLKGSLIFTDVPFVIGPKLDSPALCLGCHKFWNKIYKCSNCKWPCCNIDCEKILTHSKYECKIFSNAKVEFQNICNTNDSCIQFDCITPLRMLIAKEKNPTIWENQVKMMEDHEKERKERPTWDVDNINITEYLRGPCKLEKRFSAKLIQKICGILEVNSVEIPSYYGPNIRGIYPVLAIMSHNCVPTVVHTILSGDKNGIPQNYAQIWAADDINKGEKLEICYTNVLNCTLQRRHHLKESKFFDCECERCLDPTELGTNLSSLRCNRCENGIVIASEPLKENSSWNCSICDFSTTSETVYKVINTIQTEIDRIEENIDQLEEVLKWYQYILHSGHSIIINLKYSLLQKYGSKTQSEKNSIMEYKKNMCNDILLVLNTVAPGETRTRGEILYELHDVLVQLATIKLKKGLYTKDQYVEEIKNVVKLLEESGKILSKEDERGIKGSLGKLALKKCDELQKTLQII